MCLGFHPEPGQGVIRSFGATSIAALKRSLTAFAWAFKSCRSTDVCPTLVVIGDNDSEDLVKLAGRFAVEIPNARLVTIRDAAHLPSLEHPSAGRLAPLVLFPVA